MRKVLSVAALLFLGVSIAACGDTPTATPPTAATATVPAASSEATNTISAPSDATPTTASATGTMSDTTVAGIKARGKLIVGVKYDVPTFGYLNPASNQVEGFDVEFGKAIAEKIFG